MCSLVIFTVDDILLELDTSNRIQDSKIMNLYKYLYLIKICLKKDVTVLPCDRLET